MQIPNWISLGLAIATFMGVVVALFFGIRSIRESRNLQIARYQSELLEKLSNWVVNVQTCTSQDYFAEDFYSFKQISSKSVDPNMAIIMNLIRRSNSYAKVLEEGRNMLGIAIFFGKNLSASVKSLEDTLQKSFETLVKYQKLIDEASHNNKLQKILAQLSKEDRDNHKSIHESTTKVIGEIYHARVTVFDSVIFGKDPFRNL